MTSNENRYPDSHTWNEMLSQASRMESRNCGDIRKPVDRDDS